ncbi:MAG TPA: DUF433 domain-containing protein [Gemmataceae bacterium]|nr:DUF433 domain-containing protein [Gemmataceae bacterium]
MVAMLGHGVYTFPEAAALTGLKQSRVREWFRGRSQDTTGKPVFSGDYPAVDGDHVISFHDLIDVCIAGQLRQHGTALRTVRGAYARMEADLNSPHPFCRKELLTDGETVFLRGLEGKGRAELADVLSRQGVYCQILLPFLRQIDYDRVKLLARRWRIADLVVVDPTICFGKPIVEAAGIPTAVLAAAYRANGEDADVVARWYDVEPKHVLAAATFESSMAT